MKKIGPILVIMLMIVLGCAPGASGTNVEHWYCPPVPESFGETDLIGTWQARYFPGSVTDTLILREDGTYRQVFEDDLAGYYCTRLGKWYLEHRASGGLYLHLEGMLYRLEIDEPCDKESGGGGNWHYYDPCERQAVRMGGEVILAVTGLGDFRYPGIVTVPRGILLWHMRTEPEASDEFFILQE